MMKSETNSSAAPVERLAFNLKEVCAVLGGISPVTVWRLEKRNLLRAVPGIRHKLFAKTEVERFLAGGRRA
jgi:hypothetical protein